MVMMVVALIVGLSAPAFASPGDGKPPHGSSANVVPTLTCVTPGVGKAFTAYFGYTNEGDSVTYPDGPQNKVTPGSLDGPQPTTFTSGTTASAFSVVANSRTVNWTVAGQSVSAQASSTACAGSTLSQDPLGMSLILAIGGGALVGAIVIRRATRQRRHS